MAYPRQKLLTAPITEIQVMETGGAMIDPNVVFFLFLLGFCLFYGGLLLLDTVLERRSRVANIEGESDEYLRSS